MQNTLYVFTKYILFSDWKGTAMKTLSHLQIIILTLIVSAFCCIDTMHAQTELTPVDHTVYAFLKRMQVRGVLPEYNSSLIPISRREVGIYLQHTAASSDLSPTDKKILRDLLVEFSFDISRTDSLSYGFLNDFSFTKIFDDEKQKHFYFYSDENASLFVDGIASLSQRSFHGDRYNNSVLLGQIGMRMHGTIFNNVGFSVRLSNGQAFRGSLSDRLTAANFDNILFSNQKYYNEKSKNFDTFEGYFRFQTDNNWLSFTLGKERLLYGFGYLDKLFLSNNAVPFDFAKLDLRYKTIQYSFIYGNLVGDSLGRSLMSKLIVAHRFSVNFNSIKLGVYEAVIISERPISFTFMNPASFLVAADLATAASQTTNSLLGFDLEYLPIQNLALQVAFLIDDLNFSTRTKGDSTSNDNKFGSQFGAEWQDAFSIPNLTLIIEFTHIGQFVYSHRSNMSTYTNWKVSLGHAIPPNSDEAAVKLSFDITNRIGVSASYKSQRSASGLRFAPDGKLITNYGGDLLRGDGDYLQTNSFLNGDRYNKQTSTFELRVEPINQFVLIAHYSVYTLDNLVLQKKYTDNVLNMTIEIDF